MILKEENTKDGLVVGPHHWMTPSFKIHFPLSVHRTTTDAKTSFKCTPSFVFLSRLCILYFLSFYFLIFLYLYIARPPCWLLCMTLLTPFLRSAQMNSKSSKSVLCCEPCQGISILRIVWRLSLSFIFRTRKNCILCHVVWLSFAFFLKRSWRAKDYVHWSF